MLKRDHGSYTSQEEIQAQIKSVESEIQQQKAALSGAKTVTAKASGTYSAVCDGYESVLTEAFLEDVTPSKLNGVKAAAEQSNVGKLIYGDTWYYAVVLPAEQAAALKDMGRVDVRLAKGFDQSIRMSVVSVSREENGQAAVVLSSTRIWHRPRCCVIRRRTRCCTPIRACGYRPTRCGSARTAPPACTVWTARTPPSGRSSWYIRGRATRW